MSDGAMATRSMARRLIRFGRDHKAHLYHAACVCLLFVAAGLRFHDLAEHSLWLDEAVAANNSGGTLSEVVFNTRHHGSSPILYPLALWAVQKVDVSNSSVRVLPAAASVLTVAMMLFLLPRVGVARGAAFLAALLATLSVEAIRHAQDVREYSIDALLAVLMIAGLLRHLQNGGKTLLCASLFLAPLLQYGLVLFGAAVMGAAVVLPRATLAVPEWISYPSRIRNWLKPRIALIWPAACFLAGCAISYAVTVRYQWVEGGWAANGYLSAYYYQGKFDAQSIFEFSISRTWSLLTYHLPEVVALAALPAFAILLAVAFLRKFQGTAQDVAIAVLFSFCIAVCVGVAVLKIYPLGDIRQGIYLGPVIFLAFGVSFHWTAGCLAALTRRAWLAPALAVAAIGAMALAGVGAMRQDSPYESRENAEGVHAFLEENVQEGDLVFVSQSNVPSMRFYQRENSSSHQYENVEEGDLVFMPQREAPATRFYQGENPSGYQYVQVGCVEDVLKKCIQEMAGIVASLPNVPNRIFLVYEHKSNWEAFELLGERVSVGTIADGRLHVSLIANAKESAGPAARSAYEALVSGEPAIRSDFDVHISHDRLVYVKEPCARADTEAEFFLHLHPVNVNDLPDHRRQYGFDNLDFSFDGRGLMSDGSCMARIPLPEYDIATIITGQYTEEGRLWVGEHNFDE